MSRQADRMRTCILTGASGRLGADFIERYAARYRIVALTHVRDVRAVGAAVTIRADLSQFAEAMRAVDKAIAAVGPIDLVVNAAAIRGDGYGSLTATPDKFDRVLAVNVAAPAWMADAVGKRCWFDRSAHVARPCVVNLSSTAGHIAYPHWAGSAYPASKAALNMLTIGMAEQFASFGVRVNALAPNSFPTVVPTARVSDAIVELDRGDDSGRIRVIDVDGDYWLDES